MAAASYSTLGEDKKGYAVAATDAVAAAVDADAASAESFEELVKATPHHGLAATQGRSIQPEAFSL